MPKTFRNILVRWCDALVETIVRWRTWLVNGIGAVLIILPELLNAPEIIAIVPPGAQKYLFAAALVLNILMRPRPAVLARDPEVVAKKAAAEPMEHV